MKGIKTETEKVFERLSIELGEKLYADWGHYLILTNQSPNPDKG